MRSSSWSLCFTMGNMGGSGPRPAGELVWKETSKTREKATGSKVRDSPPEIIAKRHLMRPSKYGSTEVPL